MDYKQVIVVPRDVEMSPAKLAVQVAHACVGTMFDGFANDRNYINDLDFFWFKGGLEQKKVVLQVPTTDDLFKLEQKAKKIGLACYWVSDAGRTELKPGTITALGFEPAPNHLIDPITKRLSLYR